jgi:hypothetical protein
MAQNFIKGIEKGRFRGHMDLISTYFKLIEKWNFVFF